MEQDSKEVIPLKKMEMKNKTTKHNAFQLSNNQLH